MNKKISLEGITLKYLYEKNKFFLLPLLVLVASFVLFLQVTLPLFSEFRNTQDLRIIDEQKLSTLKNNYNVLSNANDETLDSQLIIATDALPSGKVFASILNAVSISANKSGAILGDYEFQVGDLTRDIPSVKYPSLELVLTVSGGVRTVLNFMDELYRSVPLAEVVNVEINNNRSVITVIFYYKPLPGTPPVTSPILPLSPKNLTTINTILTWNNGRLEGDIVPVVSSPSASPTSPF